MLKYFPSSTTPTIWTRVASCNVKYRPIALVSEPNNLPANSRFTATAGALWSRCQEKALPANNLVPAASKYPGDTSYPDGLEAIFDLVRSLVFSLKTLVLVPPPCPNDGRALPNPAASN